MSNRQASKWHLKKYGTKQEREATVIVNDPGLSLYGSHLVPFVDAPPQEQIEPIVMMLTVGAESKDGTMQTVEAVSSVIMNRYYQQKDCFGVTVRDICLWCDNGRFEFNSWFAYLKNIEWFERPDVYTLTRIYHPVMKHYFGLDYFFEDRRVCYYRAIGMVDENLPAGVKKVCTIEPYDFYIDTALPI